MRKFKCGETETDSLSGYMNRNAFDSVSDVNCAWTLSSVVIP